MHREILLFFSRRALTAAMRLDRGTVRPLLGRERGAFPLSFRIDQHNRRVEYGEAFRAAALSGDPTCFTDVLDPSAKDATVEFPGGRGPLLTLLIESGLLEDLRTCLHTAAGEPIPQDTASDPLSAQLVFTGGVPAHVRTSLAAILQRAGFLPTPNALDFTALVARYLLTLPSSPLRDHGQTLIVHSLDGILDLTLLELPPTGHTRILRHDVRSMQRDGDPRVQVIVQLMLDQLQKNISPLTSEERAKWTRRLEQPAVEWLQALLKSPVGWIEARTEFAGTPGAVRQVVLRRTVVDQETRQHLAHLSLEVEGFLRDCDATEGLLTSSTQSLPVVLLGDGFATNSLVIEAFRSRGLTVVPPLPSDSIPAVLRAHLAPQVPPLSVDEKITHEGVAGETFAFGLRALGGVPPYTWSIADRLPDGLVLDGTGTLQGCPTVPGTWVGLASVRDSGDATASMAIEITIFPPPLQVDLGDIVECRVGLRFEHQLGRASGGTPPVEWETPPATLPAGVHLSRNGVLSGTPCDVGVFSFPVQLRDGGGQSVGGTCRLSVHPAADGPGAARQALVTQPVALPSARARRRMEATLGVVTGGTPPYRWSSSVLPAQLELTSAGVLQGVPAARGLFTVHWSVSDGGGNTVTGETPLHVLPPLGPLLAKVATIAGLSILGLAAWFWMPSSPDPGKPISDPTPVVLDTAHLLPQATRGLAFTHQFRASGGRKPYRWRVFGTVPQGLSLTQGGVLEGTPRTVGAGEVCVEVFDSVGGSFSHTYALTIGSPAPPQKTQEAPAAPVAASLTFGSTGTFEGVVGESFDGRLIESITGGHPPYRVQVDGPRPQGLMVDSSAHLLGMPRESGTFVCTVRVRSSDGQTREGRWTFAIAPPPIDMRVAQSARPRDPVPEPPGNGTPGEVRLTLLISMAGSIRSIRIHSYDAEHLIPRARRIAESLVFTPAYADGAPIESWTSVRIRFR